MKHLIAVLLLAGCAAVPDLTKLPLRNPTAPVASQTDATLARLDGEWRVVQAAESRRARGCVSVWIRRCWRGRRCPCRIRGAGASYWGQPGLDLLDRCR